LRITLFINKSIKNTLIVEYSHLKNYFNY
jgi:hypothetical protein